MPARDGTFIEIDLFEWRALETKKGRYKNMKIETSNEEKRLFDQIHPECCHCKVTRRKISETMRRIRYWFNKEFHSKETIPKEFREFCEKSSHAEHTERLRNMWSKFL